MISNYLIVMLLSISINNPIPPLALKNQWLECVRTCDDCGDYEYEGCDYQFDPYQILNQAEENDGR